MRKWFLTIPKSSWRSAAQALVGWRIRCKFQLDCSVLCFVQAWPWISGQDWEPNSSLVTAANCYEGVTCYFYFIVKGMLAIKRMKLKPTLLNVWGRRNASFLHSQAALRRIEYIASVKKAPVSHTAACMVGLWQSNHWIKVHLLFVLFCCFQSTIFWK